MVLPKWSPSQYGHLCFTHLCSLTPNPFQVCPHPCSPFQSQIDWGFGGGTFGLPFIGENSKALPPVVGESPLFVSSSSSAGYTGYCAKVSLCRFSWCVHVAEAVTLAQSGFSTRSIRWVPRPFRKWIYRSLGPLYQHQRWRACGCGLFSHCQPSSLRSGSMSRCIPSDGAAVCTRSLTYHAFPWTLWVV